MKKLIVILLCVLISIAMIYLLFYSKSADVQNNLELLEFSQETWNQHPDKRYTMIDDLLENYDFSNMTKTDVINLLGKNLLDTDDNALRYETKGGFFKDEILQFVFDERGIFKKVGIAN